MADNHNRCKLFSNITSIFIILLVTIFLFYIGQAGYQDIAIAKYGLFRLLCGGYIVLSIILFVRKAVTGAIKLNFFQEC